MTTHGSPGGAAAQVSASRRPAEVRTWPEVRDQLHELGLRWTPQRRTIIEVLRRIDGHVSGAEILERCRQIDPGMTPSTVYRTLDVLEDVGIVRHGHGADGREEFHVLPRQEHGHLHCRRCGGAWELTAEDARPLINALDERHGFVTDLSHVTVVGECGACRVEAPVPVASSSAPRSSGGGGS